MKFWLGTHEVTWLGRTNIPLFISHRRLIHRRKLPRPAIGEWALDSGAFSELAMFGKFQTTAEDYAGAVKRYRDAIGNLKWAAIQDWMCEPFMLAKTGRTVAEHQYLTCVSFSRLMDLAPEITWVPVIQGYTRSEYLHHVDMYLRWGLPIFGRLVGVGSVCRRQRVDEGATIVKTLAIETGLALHGFGVKTIGLRELSGVLSSADSMAWSYRARRAGRLGHAHASCSNCLDFALEWRHRLLSNLTTQDHLFSPSV